MCLKGVNENTGEFARYCVQGGTELAGIISCAGCPTAVAPEKLLRRVRSLAFLQIDAIHLSSCMISLCPFKNKYARLLKNHFSGINIVEGTHVESPEVVQMFIAGMQDMLIQPQKTMADMGQQAIDTEKTDAV
jgi:predicted metal-binding protein